MLILEMAGPGEMIGLSASMSGMPYEVSAETLHPSQVSFVLRQDFVRFVNCFPEVYHAVIRQINSQYAQACEQLRTVGLSTTAQEKLARLLLHWSSKDKQASASAHIKVPLTHEQIAECVGATRETVTRTLSEFKNKHLVRFNGSTIVIPSLAALQAISGD
jgi:CRP/FNR family transcriptional regulator